MLYIIYKKMMFTNSEKKFLTSYTISLVLTLECYKICSNFQ